MIVFLNSRYFSQKKTFNLEFSCKSVHFSFKLVWCILKDKENNKGLQYLDSSPKNNNSVKNDNDTSTFKAQKCSKEIDKIVHVRSVVELECYEATTMFFVHKENKNTLLNTWWIHILKRRNFWMKSFVFFGHKKYSHSFINLQLNHIWQLTF